jgi:HEPN domain-containing protein
LAQISSGRSRNHRRYSREFQPDGGGGIFHAQQCVEKCLKALLEEFGVEIRRTHNLLVLKAALVPNHPIDLDEDALSLLNKLYIDSRYPGAFGLLPTGAPTLEDAREFADFARESMESTIEMLDPLRYDPTSNNIENL